MSLRVNSQLWVSVNKRSSYVSAAAVTGWVLSENILGTALYVTKFYSTSFNLTKIFVYFFGHSVLREPWLYIFAILHQRAKIIFTGALLHKSCVLISQSLLLQYNWHMSRGGIFSHQQMGFKSYLYDLRPNQDLEVKSYLLVTKYSSSEITFYNYNYIICIKCPSYSSIVLVLPINSCF